MIQCSLPAHHTTVVSLRPLANNNTQLSMYSESASAPQPARDTRLGVPPRTAAAFVSKGHAANGRRFC